MKLEGKVAIVTGAGRGIGRGIVHCFAREGADVVACSRTLAELEKVAGEVRALGRKSLAVKTDVTDANQVTRLVQDTLSAFGKIDILVNNVGGGRNEAGVSGGDIRQKGSSIVDLDDEDWDGAYEVNLKSAVYLCKAVVPHMKAQKSGKIINISSVAGKMGDSYRMAYSTIKGAVITFTWALARELARENINVNCICPGLIYTPLWERGAEQLRQTVPGYQELKEPKEVFLRYVKRLVPMGREQTAEDIGNAAVFLASEEAKNITGQSLNVDGGMVME